MAVSPTFKQQCPSCESMISVKVSMVGKKVECTRCKDKFIAQRPDDDDEDDDEVDIDLEVEEEEPAPTKKNTKVAGKKNTTVTSKAPSAGKRPKLDVADEDGEDDEEDAKPSAKNKAGAKGKAKKGDDEDDDDDAPKKKKKAAAGSNKLVIGLSLAGVGVVILVVAAFFMNRSKDPPVNKPGFMPPPINQAQNPDNNDKIAPPKINDDKPIAGGGPLSDAEVAKLTNLLPGDTEHVFHIACRDLFAAESAIRNAVFETPGGLDAVDLRKKLGFSVLAIDDMIVAEKNTFPNWKFTVIHAKEPLSEADLKAALKLESAGSPIEGQAYFKLAKAHPTFDQLARISFGIPNFYRYFEARNDRPSYVRLHNPQTLIVGDQVPVQAFLRAKGQFPLQTTRQQAPPLDPDKNPVPGPGKTGGLSSPGNKPEFVHFNAPTSFTGLGQAQGVPVEEVQAALNKLRERLAGTTWEGMEEGNNKIRMVFDTDKSLGVSVESSKFPGPLPKSTWALIPERPLNKISISVKGLPAYDMVIEANAMTGTGKMGGQMWQAVLQQSGANPDPNAKNDPNPRDPNAKPPAPTDPTPGPSAGVREDTYLTIKPSLKALLDRMEARNSDKDRILFSSATDMDANALDPKDTGIKDKVIRLPRQFWDVTLMLYEQKPRIRYLGTALVQRDTLKYQLRNELNCAQEIDAREFQQEMMERTSVQVAKFIQQVARHEVKLPSAADGKAPLEKPAPPPPADGEKKPEEKRPDATVSQITVKQQATTVEFVLDLLFDNPTLTQAHGIANLASGTLRAEIDAAGSLSLRHSLAGAGKAVGNKGLPDRQVPPGAFPPGAFPRTNVRLFTDKEPRNRISWMAGLLPFMGHQSLYNKIRFDQSWRDSGNWMAGHTAVPQFLDPLYPDFARQAAVGDLPLDFAATHYVGIAGVGLDAATYPRGDPAFVNKRGVLSYDGSASLAEIIEGRGVANTVLMIQVPYDRGTGVSPWIAGGGATLRGVPEKNSIEPFLLGKDRNDKPMGQQNKRGTYALMTDGSVRFIDQNVSDDVFKAMCTINGPAPQDFDLNKNANTPFIPLPEGKESPTKKPADKGPVKIEPAKKPAVNQAVLDAKDLLKGEWFAKSMEIDGKPVPGEILKAFSINFQQDKMIAKGKVGETADEVLGYSVDPTKSPRRIEISDPKEKKPDLGIYEINNGELRLCLRDSKSTLGFPSTFVTQPKSDLVLMVFTRKK